MLDVAPANRRQTMVDAKAPKRGTISHDDVAVPRQLGLTSPATLAGYRPSVVDSEQNPGPHRAW